MWKMTETCRNFCMTAMSLDYHQRIDMQSVWQNHVDASISSTVNVPNHFTVEEPKACICTPMRRV